MTSMCFVNKIPVYIAKSRITPPIRMVRLPYLSAKTGNQSKVKHHPIKYAEEVKPSFHYGAQVRSSFSIQLCSDRASSKSIS